MSIDQDLLKAAGTIAPPQPKTYFGEVYNFDLVPFFMKKGEKKRHFNKLTDAVEYRKIEAHVGISPLTGQYTIDRRQMEFDKGWQEVTLPSLAKLGKTLADLQGNPFVQVQIVACGTYTNANNEVKNLTFFRFVEFYPDRTACEDAAAAFFNRDDDATPAPAAQPAAVKLPPLDEANAKSFIELIWKMSNGNVSVFESQLAANPMLAGYTMLHPLVEQVTGIDPLPF